MFCCRLTNSAPFRLFCAMSILHWLSAAAKILVRRNSNGQRRAAKRRRLTAMDPLEPRLLLAATVLNDVPEIRLGQEGDSTEFQLDQFFDDPSIDGSVVQVETGLGTFFIETFDTITPITANNFLDLVSAGNYDDMFFHRLDDGFVLQGGGFTFPETSTTTRNVVHNGTIVNEFDNWFDPELGGLNAGDPVNLRGTIAKAKIGGDPDSATSQWFVNLADNQSLLDPQNGGFTVFAHVLFDGLDVVDAIAAVEVVDAGGVFAELPVVDLDPDATSIERENLLLSTSTVVEELSYTTTASDLVTTEILDGTLTFTATALGISQGGTTQITVTATDLQGNTAESVVDVVLAEPTLTGPTEFVESQPTISWTPAAGADSYDLRIDHLDDRFPSIIQADDIVSVDGITDTSFTLTEALPDGQYKATVRRHSASGVGEFSPEFLFYVGLETPATVAAPTVTPDAGNELDVTISWDVVAEATHYDIWLSEVGGDVIVQENWIDGTSFDATNLLQAGRSYRVWVRGRNVLNTGSWSTSTQFVAGDDRPDRVLIAPPESGNVGTTAPTLVWSADPLATDYEIFIAEAGSNIPTTRLTTTDLSYTETSVLADGFYRAWVRARNGNGAGAWSPAVTFGVTATGAAAVLTAPTGDANSSQPEFTWTAGVPGGTYQLWVNQVGGPSRVILESGITATSFTPETSLEDGLYTAWVRQVPVSGSPLGWSPAFRFEIGATTIPVRPTLAVDTSGAAPTFSWDADANAVRFELWVEHDGELVLNVTDIISIDYVATELQTVGAHRAWLRGIGNNAVAGPWSSALDFTV